MRRKYKTVTETEHGPRICWKVTRKREGKKPLTAQFGGIPLKRKKKAEITDQRPTLIRTGRTELIQRLEADECQLCGSTEKVEVHHIRALKDLKSKGRKEKSMWVQLMAKRRRKYLILCRNCHMKIHRGQNLNLTER